MTSQSCSHFDEWRLLNTPPQWPPSSQQVLMPAPLDSLMFTAFYMKFQCPHTESNGAGPYILYLFSQLLLYWMSSRHRSTSGNPVKSLVNPDHLYFSTCESFISLCFLSINLLSVNSLQIKCCTSVTFFFFFLIKLFLMPVRFNKPFMGTCISQ